MYIPKHFEQTDERALWDFIDAHSFGTLLTVVDGRPFASHLPFLTTRDARSVALPCGAREPAVAATR